MEKTFEQKIGPFMAAARPHGSAYVGLIFRDGKRLDTAEGLASLKDASDWTLRSVNELIRDDEAFLIEPAPEAVLEALGALTADMNAGYRRMLTAHLQAPFHRITATQLSKAGGYSGAQSAGNLHYGRLAFDVWSKLPRPLPVDDATQQPIWTFAIADGQMKQEWEWTMRPFIARALVDLGF